MSWGKKAAAVAIAAAVAGGAHNQAEKKERANQVPIVKVVPSDKYAQNKYLPNQGPKGSQG